MAFMHSQDLLKKESTLKGKSLLCSEGVHSKRKEFAPKQTFFFQTVSLINTCCDNSMFWCTLTSVSPHGLTVQQSFNPILYVRFRKI